MYSAYVLTQQTRVRLLQAVSPAHSDVIAHHVTYKFPDKDEPPVFAEGYAYAYAKNNLVDCFLVSINGNTRRPDGKLFHTTLSVDRNSGGKPVLSNKLLDNLSAKGVYHFQLEELVDLVLVPKILK